MIIELVRGSDKDGQREAYASAEASGDETAVIEGDELEMSSMLASFRPWAADDLERDPTDEELLRWIVSRSPLGIAGRVREATMLTVNVFCATGAGGGVDPTCSPGSGSSKEKIWEKKVKEQSDKIVAKYGEKAVKMLRETTDSLRSKGVPPDDPRRKMLESVEDKIGRDMNNKRTPGLDNQRTREITKNVATFRASIEKTLGQIKSLHDTNPAFTNAQQVRKRYEEAVVKFDKAAAEKDKDPDQASYYKKGDPKNKAYFDVLAEFKTASDELTSVQQTREKLNAKVLNKILRDKPADVAKFDIKGPPLGKHESMTLDRAKNLLDRLVSPKLKITVNLKQEDSDMARAGYAEKTNTIHVARDARDMPFKSEEYSPHGDRYNQDQVESIVHEFGHALEDQHPEVKAACIAFWEKRCGNQLEVSNSRYSLQERGREDDFVGAQGGSESRAWYNGKVYRNAPAGGIFTAVRQHDQMNSGEAFLPPTAEQISATEILSMGIERVVQDPITFAAKDPEYFSFVIGVLNGRVRGVLITRSQT